MSTFIAALPMYDWPETRAETDAEWARVPRAASSAPASMRRRPSSGAMPKCRPCPGGIRRRRRQGDRARSGDAAAGRARCRNAVAASRAAVRQTCWGPMELGLGEHVQVVGQPSYNGFEGGQGQLYSSAHVDAGERTAARHRRAARRTAPRHPARPDARQALRLQQPRFHVRLHGAVARSRSDGRKPRHLCRADRDAAAHRASIVAVAEGRADVCRDRLPLLALAKRHEPKASEVAVVGWTGLRKGLPYDHLASHDAARRSSGKLIEIAQPARIQPPSRRASSG